MIMKKIFSGEIDNEVHGDFLKFGRGDFKDRYLIEVKVQNSRLNIKTSAEFGNFFVKKCLPEGVVNIKGVIISTFDLSNEVDFEIKKVSNFQGIRKTEIEGEIEGKKILDLINRFPRCFFALSFRTPECELKIKPKAPKSAKPGKASESGPKADFCSLKTSDKSIIDDLLFDIKQDFKEVKVNHTIRVDDIIYPKDVAGMKPEEIREKSKRKGVVVRKVMIDGREMIGEAGFEV